MPATARLRPYLAPVMSRFRAWSAWAMSLCVSLTLCACVRDPLQEAPQFRDVAIDAELADRPDAAAYDPESLLISATGAELSAAERNIFQPRTDTPEYTYAAPLDWSADPFEDANWRFQLHAWRMLNTRIVAYSRTGEPHHLDHSLFIIRDWKSWHTQGRRTSYSWDDMATGLRASILAYLINEGRAGRYSPDAAAWSDLIILADAHTEVLTRPGYIRDHNHGLFAAHGLMALCRAAPELERCEAATALASTRIHELFDQQFTTDGVHSEHSPYYHWFAKATFERLASTGFYEGADLSARLEVVREVSPFLLHADGSQPGVGDTDRRIRSDELARIPPPQAACSDEAEPCLIIRHFDKAGYILVRSALDAAAPHSLFLTCAYHSDIHKHHDELSFEWWAFGGLILAESGKYGFTEDNWRTFVLSRAAHNSIDFAGEERRWRDRATYPGACTDAVAETDGVVRVSGRVVFEDIEAAHARDIHYLPNRSLTVTDTVKGGRAFTQWFHFARRVELRPLPEPGRFRADLGPNAPHITISTAAGCRAESVRGRRIPLQGWISVAYEEMEPRWSLAVHCPGDTLAAQAVFEVVDDLGGQLGIRSDS